MCDFKDDRFDVYMNQRLVDLSLQLRVNNRGGGLLYNTYLTRMFIKQANKQATSFFKILFSDTTMQINFRYHKTLYKNPEIPVHVCKHFLEDVYTRGGRGEGTYITFASEIFHMHYFYLEIEKWNYKEKTTLLQ